MRLKHFKFISSFASALVSAISAQILLAALVFPPALAQTATERPFEISVEGASFLPASIYRTHEILLGFDARVTLPTGKGKFEIDSFFANGNGESYRILSLDYRYDLGLEFFPAFITAGVNADIWVPAAPYDEQRYSGGWHFGGGFTQALFSGWSVREDFRYRLGPGTSLLIGLGLSYQIPN